MLQQITPAFYAAHMRGQLAAIVEVYMSSLFHTGFLGALKAPTVARPESTSASGAYATHRP